MESQFSSNSSGIRRSISGPELDQLCGISRQWRGEWIRRGILPQPFYITATSRPRFWLDEVEAALAARPDAKHIAAERSRHMRELREGAAA